MRNDLLRLRDKNLVKKCNIPDDIKKQTTEEINIIKKVDDISFENDKDEEVERIISLQNYEFNDYIPTDDSNENKENNNENKLLIMNSGENNSDKISVNVEELNNKENKKEEINEKMLSTMRREITNLEDERKELESKIEDTNSLKKELKKNKNQITMLQSLLKSKIVSNMKVDNIMEFSLNKDRNKLLRTRCFDIYKTKDYATTAKYLEILLVHIPEDDDVNNDLSIL